MREPDSERSVRDPQERDVADGLEQAANAEGRDASRRLGIRCEINLDVSQGCPGRSIASRKTLLGSL